MTTFSLLDILYIKHVSFVKIFLAGYECMLWPKASAYCGVIRQPIPAESDLSIFAILARISLNLHYS
jgi:hypothetical protein